MRLLTPSITCAIDIHLFPCWSPKWALLCSTNQPKVAVTYLVCQHCFVFSLFRCVLDGCFGLIEALLWGPKPPKAGGPSWTHLLLPNSAALNPIKAQHPPGNHDLEQLPSAAATWSVNSKITNTTLIRYSGFWYTIPWTFRDPSSSPTAFRLSVNIYLGVSLPCT